MGRKNIINSVVAVLLSFHRIGLNLKLASEKTAGKLIKWICIWGFSYISTGSILVKEYGSSIPLPGAWLVLVLQICCIATFFYYVLLRASFSVRWGFILYLVALFIGYFAYIIAYSRSELLENSLWSFWLFCLAFLLCWCGFSLMIDNDVSELVNDSIATLITVITLIVNLFLLSLPENSVWQKIQLPFNLFIAPFLLTSSISKVLVSMQKYCLMKYSGTSKKNMEADSRDEDSA